MSAVYIDFDEFLQRQGYTAKTYDHDRYYVFSPDNQEIDSTHNKEHVKAIARDHYDAELAYWIGNIEEFCTKITSGDFAAQMVKDQLNLLASNPGFKLLVEAAGKLPKPSEDQP